MAFGSSSYGAAPYGGSAAAGAPENAATGALSLGGSIAAPVVAGAATGALVLAGSATAQGISAAGASGALSLGGSAIAPTAPAAVSGALTFAGSGNASFSQPAPSQPAPWIGASLPVQEAGRWWAGTASINIAAFAATGTLSLGAGASANGISSAVGALSFGGSVMARVGGVTFGQISLVGVVAARGVGAASGALSLDGAADGRGRGVASGALALTGASETGATRPGAGALSLTGSASARPEASANGTLSITGVVAARGRADATGSLSIDATAASARARGVAPGSLSLAGAATAGARFSRTGTITFAGSAAGRPNASSTTGKLTLTATGTARVYTPDAFAGAEVAWVQTNGGTFSSAFIPNDIATTEADEPQQEGYSAGRSMWWRYTPTTSGLATFDLGLSSGAPVILAIFTGGQLAELTRVAFDVYSGSNYNGKVTDLPVTAETVYYIQAQSFFGNDGGVYQLQVTGPASLPPRVTLLRRVTRADGAREIAAPLGYLPEEVLRDKPAIYWRMEEGDDALDYSGNGRTGTFGNYNNYNTGMPGQTQLVDGVIGTARRFDYNYIEYFDPDTYSLTTDFSLEMWIQTTWATAGPYNGSVYNLVDVGSGQKAIGIKVVGGVSYIFGRWGQTSYSNRPTVGSFNLINDGAWHQMVLTRSGNSVRFYLDGVLIYSIDNEPPYTPATWPGMSVASFSPDVGVVTPAFDEVAYYDHPLRPVRVARHWESVVVRGDIPQNRTVVLNRVTIINATKRLLAAQAQEVAIGRVSSTSTARTITPFRDLPPGTPRMISLARATRTSTAAPMPLHVAFAQAVTLGRAIRSSQSVGMTYGAGIIFSDSFNRPDGPLGVTPEIGGPYTYPGTNPNSVQILDGALRSTSTYTMPTWPAAADFDTTVVVRTAGAMANSPAWFRFRDTGNTYWLVAITGSSLTLSHRIGSPQTVFGTIATPVGAGAAIRVVARDKIISVYLNGFLVLQAEDPFLQGTDQGFYFGETVTRIESVVTQKLTPVVPPVADWLDTELALILSVSDRDALVFKGHDSRRVDEGLMA